MAFEGTRRGRAVEVGMAATPNGKIYVAILCELTSGPEAGKRYTRKAWVNTPEQRERAARDLRTLGWRGNTFKSLKAGEMNGLGSCEASLEFQVEHNENNGKSYSTIAFVNPIAQLKLDGEVDADALDVLGGADLALKYDEETGEVDPQGGGGARRSAPAGYGGRA